MKAPPTCCTLGNGFPRIDPEAALIFGLAGRDDASVPAQSVRDWERVVRLASHENALIALRERLGGEADLVPLSVQRYIAMLGLDQAHRMRVLQARLEQSVAALNSAGIDVLLLKGAALAFTVYGSFAQRPMFDIDVMVRGDQANDARTVLLQVGWESNPQLPDDRSYRRHQHLPPLRDGSGSGLSLEIHRSLLAQGHPFRVADDVIWNAARSVDVGSARARVMHPTHHGVHIAIHFAWSHELKTRAWHAFRDLDALTTIGATDWSALADLAQEWGAVSCCYWTLQLGRLLSGLRVPEAVLNRLRPRMPEGVRRALTRHFLNALLQDGRVCPSTRLDQALWSLAIQPRRYGHGAARPWLVDAELSSALGQKTQEARHLARDPHLVRIGRASRYLADILLQASGGQIASL